MKAALTITTCEHQPCSFGYVCKSNFLKSQNKALDARVICHNPSPTLYPRPESPLPLLRRLVAFPSGRRTVVVVASAKHGESQLGIKIQSDRPTLAARPPQGGDRGKNTEGISPWGGERKFISIPAINLTRQNQFVCGHSSRRTTERISTRVSGG